MIRQGHLFLVPGVYTTNKSEAQQEEILVEGNNCLKEEQTRRDHWEESIDR